MPRSSTLYGRLDAQQDSIAVTSVSQNMARGLAPAAPSDTVVDREKLILTFQSKSAHRMCVYDPGPWLLDGGSLANAEQSRRVSQHRSPRGPTPSPAHALGRSPSE
jgi:hypothetical protein